LDATYFADLSLVGRNAEREKLQAGWARAIAGSPGLGLVLGEAGMGRTSLVRAFLTEAEGRGQVLHCRCVPVQGAAFGPLADLVLQLLDCEQDASPSQLQAALADLGKRFPHLGAMAGLVGHVLRVDTPQTAQLRLNPDALFHASLAAVGDLFESSARERPLLVTFEDLHWADHGTAAWVAAYVRRLALATGPQRVFLVATAYPEGLAPPLTGLGSVKAVGGGSFEAVTLPLGPLGMPDSLDLAGRRLGMRPAAWPPELRKLVKQVLDRAAGHPAYLVETLEALIASEVLVRSPDGWDVAATGEIDLPASVSAAISRRLETLPGELRAKLQLAAVAGARFDAQLEGTDLGRAISEGLNELVRLRLLDSSRPSLAGTLQSVTYAGIGEDRRKALHLEIGEALETLAGPLAGPLASRFAGELAHHFGEAGDAVRAYAYSCLLAERARDTALATDACRWYAEALGWASKVEVWDSTLLPPWHARLRLAQAQIQVGQFDAALATLEVLAAEGPLSPEALRTRGLALERQGNMLASLEAIEHACKRSGGDGLEAGRSMLALGDTQRRMGKLAEAIVTVENAQMLLGPAATPAEEALAHGILGICYRRLGDIPRARLEHQKALEIREKAGDLEGLANSLNNTGILATAEGDFAAAERNLGEALAMFCRLGNQPGAAMVLNNLADVYIKEGRLQEAESRLLEAQALAEQLGYASERVTTTANLADLYLARGNPAEALRLLERCLSLAVRAGLREFLPEIHSTRGRAYVKAGDRALATMAFQEACDLAEKAGNEAFAIQMRTTIASLASDK